jgi:hypothetical protein
VCHHPAVEEDEARRELEATVAARKELGPEYEHHLVESFLEKLERGLDRRRQDVVPPDHHGVRTPALLGSVGIGIPVTAIALSNSPGAGGVVVAIVAWIAIAVANVAFWRR